jgi:plastocyanin
MKAAFLVLCGAALLAAGCAKSSEAEDAAAEPAQSSSAATAEVHIDNFTFSPAALTVAAGTRVTWINRDDVPHTVASSTRPRLLQSPTLDSDDKFSHVFTKPGTYEYFCTVHPKMTGTIIVK